ncbi:hypothetical protein BV898_07464 [Hypsibius exemplaris]|uniref:DDE-1 domain-containing protein n=1 Tax=Hypsibius exemplaris TaxID=2072580 RepID=A0A1W0WTE6_HYPEX|nr:hypothetical protein BV898_07464 [Hypsibius exemplaris]
MDSRSQLLEERNVRQILIPVGMTGKWQPLDVIVNNVFKSLIKVEYRDRRNKNESFTPSNFLWKPSRQDFVNFVFRAWYNDNPQRIKKSFIAAEIIGKSQINGVAGEEVVGVAFSDESDYDGLFGEAVVGIDEETDKMSLVFS